MLFAMVLPHFLIPEVPLPELAPSEAIATLHIRIIRVAFIFLAAFDVEKASVVSIASDASGMLNSGGLGLSAFSTFWI